MAVQYIDNLSYLGAKPNFSRDSVATKRDLQQVTTNKYNNGHLIYCLEDNLIYVFDEHNVNLTDTDNTVGIGRCRPLKINLKQQKNCIKIDKDEKDTSAKFSLVYDTDVFSEEDVKNSNVKKFKIKDNTIDNGTF